MRRMSALGVLRARFGRLPEIPPEPHLDGEAYEVLTREVSKGGTLLEYGSGVLLFMPLNAE